MDDTISDDEQDIMTPEEQGAHRSISHSQTMTICLLLARFDDAMDKVKEVIGDEGTSTIPDSYVKDVVWENYFDVQKSIEDLLGE